MAEDASKRRLAQPERTSPSRSAAPDWEKVPFDVGCARCGHDLRGRTEPVCPACELTFDWADAVPIERLTCGQCGYHLYGLRDTRCPECGVAFTWEGVLAEYHRHRQPWFESRWRSEPVSSFFTTLLASLRPGRLWRRMELHDPPAVGALMAMAAVSLIVFCTAPWVLRRPGSWVLTYIGLLNARPGWSWNSYIGPWASYFWEPWAEFSLFTLSWGILGFTALLLLRQSMARCRIRTAHVLRAYTYAVLPVAAAPLVCCAAAFIHDIGQALFGPWDGADLVGILLLGTLFLSCCLWVPCSVAIAYRHYIKMKHAWGVALASHVIGFLGALLLIAWWSLLTLP